MIYVLHSAYGSKQPLVSIPETGDPQQAFDVMLAEFSKLGYQRPASDARARCDHGDEKMKKRALTLADWADRIINNPLLSKRERRKAARK